MAYPVRNKNQNTPDGCLRQPVSSGIYLLIGADIAAKETQLKKIKQTTLSSDLQDFNLDTLYAHEIKLKDIQERFLAIPLKSEKRIIVIKEADALDEESRKFILNYAKSPFKQLILVLDFPEYNYKDPFVKALVPQAHLSRFKETVNPDTFMLNRQIQLRKAGSALEILSQLLKNGEAPERILGGLRYAWEKQDIQSQVAKKKLKLLLNCDIEIKTGRLRPAFALEKLVVNLCAFV